MYAYPVLTENLGHLWDRFEISQILSLEAIFALSRAGSLRDVQWDSETVMSSADAATSQVSRHDGAGRTPSYSVGSKGGSELCFTSISIPTVLAQRKGTTKRHVNCAFSVIHANSTAEKALG